MYLLIGDLHLTDRPRDAYRFGIFKWIREQHRKFKPKATVILGDLCEQKNYHSATLVNRISNEIDKLERPIYILMGNHDYIDPKNPFFKFLGLFEGVEFIVTPTEIGDLFMIPHCRDETAFAEACACFYGHPTYLLLHNTFTGAIAETGAPLTGFSASPIEALAPRLGTYAGDVHRPQQAGPVTYVGAPYNVRFGDNFTPRCLVIDAKGQKTNLYFDCPRKWSLTVRSSEDIIRNNLLIEGDQVKLEIELAREEAVDWKTIKLDVMDACREMKLEVFGVTLNIKATTERKALKVGEGSVPEDVLTAFCSAENVPNAVKQAGVQLIKE